MHKEVTLMTSAHELKCCVRCSSCEPNFETSCNERNVRFHTTVACPFLPSFGDEWRTL